MSLNRERIWLGGFVGGVVWIIWSLIINMVVIGRARYEAMQAAGLFLKEGRATDRYETRFDSATTMPLG